MQVSQQLQRSQPCSQAAQLSDAQSWAKQVAAAAGVSVRSILSMAEGGGAVLASPQVAPDFAANVTLFNPVAVPVPATFPFFTPTVLNTPHLACSLTIQFQLM